jgi:hypothetical protein
VVVTRFDDLGSPHGQVVYRPYRTTQRNTLDPTTGQLLVGQQTTVIDWKPADGASDEAPQRIIVQTSTGPKLMFAVAGTSEAIKFLVVKASNNAELKRLLGNVTLVNGNPLTDAQFHRLTPEDIQRLVGQKILAEQAYPIRTLTTPDYQHPNGTVTPGATWYQDPETQDWWKDILPIVGIGNAIPGWTNYVGVRDDDPSKPAFTWAPGVNGVPAPTGPGVSPTQAQRFTDPDPATGVPPLSVSRYYRGEDGEVHDRTTEGGGPDPKDTYRAAPWQGNVDDVVGDLWRQRSFDAKTPDVRDIFGNLPGIGGFFRDQPPSGAGIEPFGPPAPQAEPGGIGMGDYRRNAAQQRNPSVLPHPDTLGSQGIRDVLGDMARTLGIGTPNRRQPTNIPEPQRQQPERQQSDQGIGRLDLPQNETARRRLNSSRWLAENRPFRPPSPHSTESNHAVRRTAGGLGPGVS